MNTRVLLLSIALVAVGLPHVVSALPPPPPPNPIPCTNVDLSNPHFYGGFSSFGASTTQGQTGAGVAVVYSTNGVPTGCDQLGSDGDNEQGLAGAQMPLTGATCPYSQGASTVGHHANDFYAVNLAGLDVTWSSGVDGQDPAATLAGQTCTGNGIVASDPTTDPADCSDGKGANVNLLGFVHEDTHLTATNSATSGYTCLDAVDGNAWTFLNVGPFVGTNAGNGDLVVLDPTGNLCIEVEPIPGPIPPPPPCIVTINLGWTPPTPNGVFGLSIPLSGTIASETEPDSD
jgi:hypothetical protein